MHWESERDLTSRRDEVPDEERGVTFSDPEALFNRGVEPATLAHFLGGLATAVSRKRPPPHRATRITGQNM
jgi:hypothetical protein